jgi:hypothetical protein
MPRSDVREDTVTIVGQPCGRRGRYVVARLLEKHGAAMLTDLITTVANCPKARSASIKVVYEGLAGPGVAKRQPAG